MKRQRSAMLLELATFWSSPAAYFSGNPIQTNAEHEEVRYVAGILSGKPNRAYGRFESGEEALQEMPERLPPAVPSVFRLSFLRLPPRFSPRLDRPTSRTQCPQPWDRPPTGHAGNRILHQYSE